jgi:hypothetical protein
VILLQIFYKACHVCVWLGEDTNGSETMHTFLPKLLDLAQVDKIVEKESTPEQWQAFSALVMRAWFNRRWIIQELISAEDVTLYCGETFWIEWKDFCDAVALFGAKFDAVRELF